MLLPFKTSNKLQFVSAVYRIICVPTEHCYVGATTNLTTRIGRHRSDLYNSSHSCKQLQEEWNQYGIEHFRIEVLEEGDPEGLHLIEERYKKKFHDDGLLMNSLRVSPVGFRNPFRPITLPPARVDAYWERVIQTDDGCWRWVGRVEQGRACLGVYDANRVAYMIHNGVDPQEKFVRHACHNPTCTRPDHLILGSQRENKRDQAEAFRGPRMMSSKEFVEEVRRRYMDGERMCDLVREYGRQLQTIIQNKSFHDPNYTFIHRGSRKAGRKRTVPQETVDDIRKRGREGEGSRVLAKEYGLSQTLVCQIISGYAFPEKAA